MTTPDLFDGAFPDPEPEPSPPEGLGKDAQTTWRRRQMLAKNIHPATRVPLLDASNAETCADCQHLWHKRMRSFEGWKCELAATDDRDGPDMVKSWPACGWFEAKP